MYWLGTTLQVIRICNLAHSSPVNDSGDKVLIPKRNLLLPNSISRWPAPDVPSENFGDLGCWLW